MKKLLEGKTPANKITENLTKEIKNLKNDGINPTLCVIEVGDDPASKIYLRVKRNLAKKVGINEVGLHFPADTSQAELLGKIKELNQDPNINGIMVQLPVPPQIDPRAIFETIAPEKDADGFSPLNLGRLWEGQSDIIPATVRSILTLIDYYGIEMAGKNTVIIGRSVIVGKPLATSPINLPFSRFMPTSIITAPSFTIFSVTKCAFPTSEIMTSAFLVKVAKSLVLEWAIVTVASRPKRTAANGFPTITLRPIITVFLPAISIP